MAHDYFMRQALSLAQEALGLTSPNPLVGAVLVKDNRLIATGFHSGPGQDHAELAAIKQAKAQGLSLKGTTLYCNLEPCCHHNKRTPPCAQRIINEDISEVYVAHQDPNPEVSGKSIRLLRNAGVKVHLGLLSSEAQQINENFIINMTQKRPMIHLKWAQTLDGQIAAYDHSSQWITKQKARANVHRWRLAHDAVMIGANTLRKDDPSLTIRLWDNPSNKVPWRVVVSNSGNLPVDKKLFNDNFKNKTIVLVPETTNSAELTKLQQQGITIHRIPTCHGQMDPLNMVKSLQRFGIFSVFVEGGSQLISYFLKNELFDRVSVYMGAKILGSGIGATTGIHQRSLFEAIELHNITTQKFDDDILISANKTKEYLSPCSLD